MSRFTRPMRWSLGVLIAVPVLLAGAARADVTITQEGKISGLGGFMNSEMSTVTKVKGDMKCDDTEMRMTNKMMKMMGGGKPIETTSIINLDKGVMYNIDHKDKSYTEMPLSAVGDMAAGMAQPGMYNQKKGEKSPMLDTTDVTMSKPTFDIQKTGNSETIGGHKCNESILTMVIEGVDKKSGSPFKFTTVMNLWLAKDVEGAEEFNDFNKKMAAQMGLSASAGMNGSMAGLLASYGLNSDELSDEMKQLDGFPMRTVATFDGEGGQFDEMNQMKSAGKGGDENGEQSAAAAKMLKGLFGGGDDEEGGDHMMTMTMEVKDISTSSIDAASFEPPAKYKMKKYDSGK